VEWDRYRAECGESLGRVAAEQSIEIQGWSTDLALEDGLSRITHHVHACGELTGEIPNLLQWSLAPARDYETLDILARALESGVLRDRHLKRAAEANCLRYDRKGKLLPDPIPAQLLALALAEQGWRRLVSPGDNPWAYLNTATRRIYQRGYLDGNGPTHPQKVPAGLSPQPKRSRTDPVPAGDELVVENIFDIIQNAGCSPDATTVAMARLEGKTWSELPEHLTTLTGANWDRRRVEAARGSFRRKKGKLRAAALAGSCWKPGPNSGFVHRQRLRDGAAWNGLWTYAHTLQGDDLEIYREVMANERKKLFRTY